MGLSFFNAMRARQKMLEKTLAETPKEVVVEPTSPESIGEVGSLQEDEPKEDVEVKEKETDAEKIAKSKAKNKKTK